jgi:hypothetical protein
MVEKHERMWALKNFLEMAERIKIDSPKEYDQARNFLHVVESCALFAQKNEANKLDDIGVIVRRKLHDFATGVPA